jgi:hypothetical protein
VTKVSSKGLSTSLSSNGVEKENKIFFQKHGSFDDVESTAELIEP